MPLICEGLHEALLSTQACPQSSWSNEAAYQNMAYMVVTFSTLHEERSLLNAEAW